MTNFDFTNATSADITKQARVQMNKAVDASDAYSSARAETLRFVSHMDLSGAPEGPVIETSAVTAFLKDVFVGRMGYAGWAMMDEDTQRNSTKQSVLRQVLLVAMWARDTGAFCTKDGDDSVGAVVIPTPTKGKRTRLAGCTYIRNSAIPAIMRDDDAAAVMTASFTKLADYAKKHFAKGGGNKHSKLFTLLTGIIDQDGEDGVILPGDVQQNLDMIDDAQHVLELLAEEAAKIQKRKQSRPLDAVAA